jgi:nucleoside-diphosphate-sugar epimerase
MAHGWRVKSLYRGSRVRRDGHVEWLAGDAMAREDVLAAARGASVIVHAVNPPGYRRWSELVMPMLQNTLAAAKMNGALIVLPGTVYNFGPDAAAEPAEDAPQHPVTRKGAIRVEMEQALQAFAERGGRTLIVRAGDFFGPNAGNNWFSQGLIRPRKPVRTVLEPGRQGIGHQWCYLPDLAQAIARLIERRTELEPFARFHFGGHWDPDGNAMSSSICRTVQREAGILPRLRAFPWWLIRLAPWMETFREMQEMRYLWRQPLRMRNDKLVGFLGAEPHTPWDEAVAATLHGLSCLGTPTPR